jgi:two-component system, cell cycle response regulator
MLRRNLNFMPHPLKKILFSIRRLYPQSIPGEFYQGEMEKSRRFLRLAILFIGCVTALFIVPDLTFIRNQSALLRVILVRAVFLAIVLAMFFLIKRFRSFRILSLVVTLYELCFFVVFTFILLSYPTPDFMIQVMGVIVFVIVIYLIPNRWPYMLTVSLVADACFLIYTYFIYPALQPRQYLAGVVYILLATFFCAFSALWSLKYRLSSFYAMNELKYVYSTDPLTKTRNRFKLIEEAEKWMGFCSRHGMPLSLVLIDVDDLKKINDEYGHMVGDSVLTDIGSIIVGQIRSMDLCVRWGGDEFVLLLPNTLLEDAVILSERIRGVITARTFECGPVVTCSFGSAEWQEGWSLEKLIEEADKSMYSAKKSGKNKVIPCSNPE